MLITTLLVLLICIATMLLTIHDKDEINRIIAFLSGLIAILCVFILTPLMIKILLGLLFFTITNKILSDHKKLSD